MHTPGPWRTKSNGNVWVGLDSTNASDPEYGAADSTRGIERSAIATFHGTRATANATLAAAAPELLAACEEMVAEWDRRDEDEDRPGYGPRVETAGIVFARAAIAKSHQS